MMKYFVLGSLCLALVLADVTTTESSAVHERVARESDMPNPSNFNDMASKARDMMHTAADGMRNAVDTAINGMTEMMGGGSSQGGRSRRQMDQPGQMSGSQGSGYGRRQPHPH